jgi:hypothetical protein
MVQSAQKPVAPVSIPVGFLPTMPNQLNINAMDERHNALTPHIAGSYREAASVCLSRHHSPPIEVTLSDNGKTLLAELAWVAPDERTSGAWANATDTTEAGAYACVIAAVELMRNLFAVRRAETGTGADYYIGPQGSGQHDLEECVRLEVSGLSEGNLRDVTRRLLEKVSQAQEGESNLPALAGVIGFSSKAIMIKDVAEIV